jgi:hypothetical protein
MFEQKNFLPRYLSWTCFLWACLYSGHAFGQLQQDKIDLRNLLDSAELKPSDVRAVGIAARPLTDLNWPSGLVDTADFKKLSINLVEKNQGNTEKGLKVRYEAGILFSKTTVYECAGRDQNSCSQVYEEKKEGKTSFFRIESNLWAINSDGNFCLSDDSCEFYYPSWVVRRLADSAQPSSRIPDVLGVLQAKDQLLVFDTSNAKIWFDINLESASLGVSLGRITNTDFDPNGQLLVTFENGAIVLDFIGDRIYAINGTQFMSQGGSLMQGQRGFTDIRDSAGKTSSKSEKLLSLSPFAVVWESSVTPIKFVDGKLEIDTDIPVDGTVTDTGSNANGDVLFLARKQLGLNNESYSTFSYRKGRQAFDLMVGPRTISQALSKDMVGEVQLLDSFPVITLKNEIAVIPGNGEELNKLSLNAANGGMVSFDRGLLTSVIENDSTCTVMGLRPIPFEDATMGIKTIAPSGVTHDCLTIQTLFLSRGSVAFAGFDGKWFSYLLTNGL